MKINFCGNPRLLYLVFFFVILGPMVFLLFILPGCKNEEESPSLYADILSNPTYASLTDSIRDQPKNDELYFKRAVLLNKNNLPEPALADFQKAWQLRKDEKYAFGVTTSLLEKRPDSAIFFLHEALQQLPESFLLKLSLARAYDAVGKPDEALKIANTELLKMPEQVDLLVLQSELFEKKGDTISSARSLEKAFKVLPGNKELAFRLAYAYAETKDPKVLALCDSLIRADTQQLYAEPYYIKGNYFSKINDKTKALQWYNATIKRDYNYLNAYIESGKILLQQKKTIDALKLFQLANTIKPAFPDAYYWIGVSLETLGQKEEAKLNYEKAVGLDKGFVEAREAVGRLGN